MSRPFAALALLGFARSVFAHEHHGEDIPEGEAVSAEPIVRLDPWEIIRTVPDTVL